MTNDYYDDDENLLEEIIQQEQQGSLRRKLNNEALENGEEYRYILNEYLNNWTIFYWVLKRNLVLSPVHRLLVAALLTVAPILDWEFQTHEFADTGLSEIL